MTPDEVREILRDVRYKQWEFHLGEGYLQVRFPAQDSASGLMLWWTGRKWRLSSHMTKNEIIQTAFLAVRIAEEHEVRESFRYKDKPIFGPHFDVDRLVALCDEPLDVRIPPGIIQRP